MTERENYLRAITFQHPEWIPVNFVINTASYLAYDQNFLFDEIERHKLLFPYFKRPQGKYEPVVSGLIKKDVPYYDDFGCRWETAMDGILGTVVEHPLADLSKLNGYTFPDPNVSNGLGAVDWEKERVRIETSKKENRPVTAGLRHGHTFLQMCDIRGYQNFLFDMMDEEPYLKPFMTKLTDFNLEVAKRYLSMGIDFFQIPEDLGMQVGPMLSVDNFNEYILPCYKRIIDEVKKHDALVHMHSDGDIRLLVDGLVTDGVDVINLQDRVNGIDWIKDTLKGKVCIDLDIDRQKVIPFGTTKEVDEFVKNEIKALDDKAGGLVITFGLYPDVKPENISALMDALERYMVK